MKKHRNEVVLNNKVFRHVGNFGVDAGLVWIGDPCYIIANDTTESRWPEWYTFLQELDALREKSTYPAGVAFPYKLGHNGLGVCLSTGYGDGTYPVFAHITDEGVVGGIFIDFTGLFKIL